MTSLANEDARAVRAKVTRDSLAVDLVDGRTVIAPLAWYPRLLHGSPAERARWRLFGKGVGIHWPDLDEDISVEGLLAGRASGESQRSLDNWLANRRPNQGAALDRGQRAIRPKPQRRVSGRGK